VETALDCGIAEADFWNMTIGELRRAIESYQRTEKQKAKERASYDYILAELIGRSVGRAFSNRSKFPEVYEVYPSLFDGKEIEEERRKQQAMLSTLRFKQFANFHNEKLGGGKNK
jgi:hypothetical protein